MVATDFSTQYYYFAHCIYFGTMDLLTVIAPVKGGGGWWLENIEVHCHFAAGTEMLYISSFIRVDVAWLVLAVEHLKLK